MSAPLPQPSQGMRACCLSTLVPQSACKQRYSLPVQIQLCQLDRPDMMNHAFSSIPELHES